jgi:peptidyl-prolyl cis-trans isomerase A (cyclophilin A)
MSRARRLLYHSVAMPAMVAMIWSHGPLGLITLGGASCTTQVPAKSDAAGAKDAADGKADGKAALPDAPAALLDPDAATTEAPASYKVELTTTKGRVVIDVHRDWAPLGADRFYNLVKLGFYDDVAFFRVVSGFMVQFGMHGHPDVSKAWKPARITDDPRTQRNAKGTISFANSGKNTRTTQVFINFNDNAPLDNMGFAPFGEVVEGMDVVEKLHSGYGDGPPSGSGPDQREIERNGNGYLKRRFPELDYIQSARVLE